jgi:hypothetical protein
MVGHFASTTRLLKTLEECRVDRARGGIQGFRLAFKHG